MSEPTVLSDASSPDVIIVGSGMGGATLAAGLAPTGARIVILERGEQLKDTPETRDARAIFQTWILSPNRDLDRRSGSTVQPRQLLLCRRKQQVLRCGSDPIPCVRLPADYSRRREDPRLAVRLRRVGALVYKGRKLVSRLRRTRRRPHRTAPFRILSFAGHPDEPAIAATRERLRRTGLHPASLPLGVDISAWMKRAATPWDAFPDARTGKMDAETCGLAAALAHPNVTLQTGTKVQRLIMAPDGKHIEGVECDIGGERHALKARLIVLSAGAVNSAALLLRSSERGVANKSDKVGRHFMNHNSSAVLAVDPRTINDSIYQKTFGINDFYLDDGAGGPPLGNIQLLGRVTGQILKANLRRIPDFSLNWLGRHAVDFYAMSEDLPNPDSRVTLDGAGIRLDWKRSNWASHLALVAKLRERLRAAGLPIVLARAFDRRTPSHQCGTVRSAWIRRRRRSIPIAVPTTIQIFSWSTPRCCRHRRRSTQR